ncbi:hypothetical protein EV359DRAFT_69161 [Lentinula novae-zelandiae]|nr:hypothetical protein EV359DRAFT_69161 [Lentinula novae-zelandiae]
MTDNDGTTSQQEGQSPSQSQDGNQQQQNPSEGQSHRFGGIDNPPSLSRSSNLSQEALTQSFSLYIKLLDSIENRKSKAAERGGNGELNIAAMNRKRPFEGEEEESEDDIDPQSASRRKIDETVLPWLNRASLSESLEKTRVILANLAREPKYARCTIQSQPDCPVFSTEDWDDIVNGKPARFDHIFSSMHATTLDERQTQKVGEVEFKFGPPVPGKRVNNSGDWQIVFAKYSKALTFVFPHRADELKRYSEHIVRLFGALPELDHDKVINYDKAIRYR